MRQPLSTTDYADLVGRSVEEIETLQHPFQGTVTFVRFEGDYLQAFWTREVQGPDGQPQVQSLTILYGPNEDEQGAVQPVAVQQPAYPPGLNTYPQSSNTYTVPPQSNATTDDPYAAYYNQFAGAPGVDPRLLAAMIEQYQQRTGQQPAAPVQPVVQPQRPLTTPEGTPLPKDLYDPSFLTRLGVR